MLDNWTFHGKTLWANQVNIHEDKANQSSIAGSLSEKIVTLTKEDYAKL